MKETFITRAMREANKSAMRHKIAALIIVKNRVVAAGLNSMKTHPFQKKFSSRYHRIFLHAEISALIKAGENAKDGILYIARKRCDGSAGISKPCGGCVAAAIEAGIKSIVFYDETWKEIDISQVSNYEWQV